MGRNMFGGGPGPWDERNPWTGWWGPDPPYHTPVFVLTHHPREPLEMEGGTTFHFVTDGIERALERAVEVAGDRDINLAGGADAIGQYLAAGLVDLLEVHVVPVLLGGGERLFDLPRGWQERYERDPPGRLARRGATSATAEWAEPLASALVDEPLEELRVALAGGRAGREGRVERGQVGRRRAPASAAAAFCSR